MTCPQCGSDESRVIDSRPGSDLGGELALRRRRVCSGCGCRWSTYEVHGQHYEALQAIARTVAQLTEQMGRLAALREVIDRLPNLTAPGGLVASLERKSRRKAPGPVSNGRESW